MGITIATKDRRFTLKLDDDKSEEMFNNIVTKILTGGYCPRPPVMERKEPDRKWKKVLPVPQQSEREEPDLTAGQPEEEDDVRSVATQELAPSEKPKGYEGFLYLECPHCGRRRAFCSRYPLKYYKCDSCGKKTDLHDLVQMFLNCECGRNSAYLTNVTDEILDVNCIDCGMPVAVQYNAKKKLYETIQ